MLLSFNAYIQNRVKRKLVSKGFCLNGYSKKNLEDLAVYEKKLILLNLKTFIIALVSIGLALFYIYL
jgi:hypothetical protein